MTFIDTLSTLGEASATDIGRGLLAPLVRQGLNEGLSANEMLRAIRATGLGIRRQSFLQLVGEVRSSSALAQSWSQMALDEDPARELIQEWHGGAQDTYLFRVYTYVRTSIGGTLSVERRGMSILTRALITPQEAIDRVTELYQGEHPTTTGAGEEFLGAEFGGVYHQVAAA